MNLDHLLDQADHLATRQAVLALSICGHQAEYDRRTASDFSRAECQFHLADARTLNRNWAVRNTPPAQFFLLALLLKDLGRFAD